MTERHISARRKLDSGESVEIRAERCRMERTGAHAAISIWLGATLLASDNFNVERDSDRVRLANSAGKQMGAVSAALYPAAMLKHDLDIFARGLWEQWLGQIEIGPLAGATDYSPPDFLLAPYIVAGSGTILFAAPGSGKSWLAMLMAVSIDTGGASIWPTRKAPVLYINLERSAESMRQRLGQVNHVLGLERSRPISMLNARGRRLGAIVDRVERYIESAEIGVVILDSISRASNGGSLTTDDTANAIMDTLNSLGASWMAIGHTSRESGAHVYGSQMFDAAGDIAVRVNAERRENVLGIALQVTKQNDGAFPAPETWGLEFGENGLEGVRRAHPYEFPELEAKNGRTLRERILDVLTTGEQTPSEIGSATGTRKDQVSRELAALLHDGDVSFRQEGRFRFYRLFDS